jgi:hypothetical protein
VIDGVLKNVSGSSPEILGHSVKIPSVSVTDLPDNARQRLSAALGIPLTKDFGVVTVFNGEKLKAAQDAIRIFDRLLIPFVVLGLLFFAAAIWVSPRRRRTLLQLLAGIGVGLVLIRRLAFRLQDDVVNLVKVEANKPAVKSVMAAFIDPLLHGTEIFLWVLFGVAVIALLSGPYGWAVSLRHGVVSTARGSFDAVRGRAEADTTVTWVRAHRDPLLIGGGVALVLALWIFNLSWLGVLILLLLVGAYELYVYRTATGPPTPEAAVPEP